MKHLAILFFLFVIIHVSNGQVQDTIYYDINWKESCKIDAKYYRLFGKDLHSGLVKVKDYYITGEIQMEGQYLTEEMETKTGKFIWFYKNGNIDYEGSYTDGKKVGKWIYYFKDKKVSANVEYKNGDIISEKYWNEDGKVFTDVVAAKKSVEYPGGENNLRRSIQTNLKFPEEAQRNGVQGRVYVSFVIDSSGFMKNIRIARSVCSSLDKEALRVVNLLEKKWIPGKSFNRPYDFEFTIPINFAFNTDEKENK